MQLHIITLLSGIAATALLAGNARAQDNTDTGFATCLQNIESGSPYSNSSSRLVLPSSPSYSTDRLGFNYAFVFDPSAIFYASSTEDAAAAIQCAASHNVSVAPRSGGHSYEGYCEGGRNGALVIDLSNLQEFSVDNATMTAKYGAGHRLGQLYTKLWQAGEYFIPAGTCPTVGVGGHGLGGGIGLIARKYGMLTDVIVGMTFVTASGQILNVTESSNPDLFWALRGAGGGSYGLVTEFHARVFKAPPTVTVVSAYYNLSDYSNVISGYAEWMKTAPEEIFGSLNLGSVDDGISLLGLYLGDSKDAAIAANNLFNLTGPPISSGLNETNWFDAATSAAYMLNGTLANPVVGDAHYAKGRSLVYRQPMSRHEEDIIYQYLSNQPNGTSGSYIIIDTWGGKINSPDSPASFDNHRGVLFSIEFVSEWDGVGAAPGLPPCQDCLAWSLAFARDMQAAYSSGPLEAYQNYIERDLPDYLNAYYGSSLQRLKEVKTAVDPLNVFSFPQSIPVL